MKNIRFLLFVFTIATLVLSACGAVTTPDAGSGKVEAMPVTFIGTIDSIAGDQWVISGTTITVDPAIVRDGSFNVGDQVKVEGVVNADGSLTVSRVEVPTPQDVATATLHPFGDTNTNDANGNANINDGNINDGNINDDNSNGLNSNNDNSNDDNGNSSNSNSDDINDDNSNGLNSNDDDRDDDNGNGSNSNSDDSSNDNPSGNGSKSDDDDHNGSGGNSNGDDDSGGNGNDD